MKKTVLAGIALGCMVLLAACSNTNDSLNIEPTLEPSETLNLSSNKEDIYHKITTKEAKEMMEDEEKNVIIVDVRTEEEYKESHIPGAILIPNESIGSEELEELPDKDAVLLIYCRTGNRSKKASDKLIELGYTKIYDFGGIVDWSYETESSEAE